MPPAWRYEPFAGLSVDELYRILALRQRVFVVEQTCAYLDADGWDRHADHLWLEDGDVAVACLRAFAPGVKCTEACLGRIVTAPEKRGTGLGHALVVEGLGRLEAQHGPVPVRISAQAYLERFYRQHGFDRASDDYDEDGIPHLAMVRPASPSR
ncbi:MAG TPA: GNAT family N-acetyltransferase [Kofleriaceae bacterium]|nr:GNAT family N-acetyltransferase [Kofleriaceae bacterium]